MECVLIDTGNVSRHLDISNLFICFECLLKILLGKENVKYKNTFQGVIKFRFLQTLAYVINFIR